MLPIRNSHRQWWVLIWKALSARIFFAVWIFDENIKGSVSITLRRPAQPLGYFYRPTISALILLFPSFHLSTDFFFPSLLFSVLFSLTVKCCLVHSLRDLVPCSLMCHCGVILFTEAHTCTHSINKTIRQVNLYINCIVIILSVKYIAHIGQWPRGSNAWLSVTGSWVRTPEKVIRWSHDRISQVILRKIWENVGFKFWWKTGQFRTQDLLWWLATTRCTWLHMPTTVLADDCLFSYFLILICSRCCISSR